MAQSGAPVVVSPGSSSLSSATVRGSLFVSAGILDGCFTELKGAEIDGAGGSASMQAGRPPPRCDPHVCGQRVGAMNFASLSCRMQWCRCLVRFPLTWMVLAASRTLVSAMFPRCTVTHASPSSWWRTGSSSLLMKRRSSSTLSRSQARGRPSACAARAEAGGSHDNFASFFDRCADPVTRICGVTSVMHHNLGFTPHAYSTARNSQFAHSRATVMHGRVSLNSENSVGDTEAGGQRFCVPGETKLLSTSTRRGVRCSAVDESAHPQQTPSKLHDETWAGLLRNQGPKIFREVEIVPGCAVAVACPSCPDHSPEPLGPGRIIRNMLSWTLEEKRDQSGYGCSGVPSKGRIFFLPLAQLETGKGRGRTTQRWRFPVIPHALVRMRVGKAPLSGHILESDAGHCSPVCGGLSHP